MSYWAGDSVLNCQQHCKINKINIHSTYNIIYTSLWCNLKMLSKNSDFYLQFISEKLLEKNINKYWSNKTKICDRKALMFKQIWKQNLHIKTDK